MVTIEEHHVDELLESLGPKEWVLSEMAWLHDDFAALYRYRDELLEAHRGDWVAVYHGELICVAPGPREIYTEIERRGFATWQVAMCSIRPVRPFHLPFQVL